MKEPVMKTCIRCGQKFNLTERAERQKNVYPNKRLRHERCNEAKCQKAFT